MRGEMAGLLGGKLEQRPLKQKKIINYHKLSPLATTLVTDNQLGKVRKMTWTEEERHVLHA